MTRYINVMSDETCKLPFRQLMHVGQDIKDDCYMLPNHQIGTKVIAYVIILRRQMVNNTLNFFNTI